MSNYYGSKSESDYYQVYTRVRERIQANWLYGRMYNISNKEA